jgi:hypothetical protein
MGHEKVAKWNHCTSIYSLEILVIFLLGTQAHDKIISDSKCILWPVAGGSHL